MKQLKLYLTLALCILLSGCNQPAKKTSEELQEEAKYLSVLAKYQSYNNCSTDIELYDKDGKILNSESIKSKGDLSYQRLIDDKYYMFGPGGLLEIDNKKLTVKKLADDDINDIDIEGNDMYVFINIGFTNNSKYASKVKTLDGDFELDLDYHVADLEYHNGNLYIHTSLESQNGKKYINVYDGKKEIDSFEVADDGNFYVVNDVLYFLTQTNLLNVDSKVKYPLIDETKKPFSMFFTSDAIHKYHDGYILINTEMSGSSFYFMDLVDDKIELKEIDVSKVGDIKNYINVENDGFYIVNRDDELFKLTIEKGKSNIQQIKLDFKSNNSLFIGYEVNRD